MVFDINEEYIQTLLKDLENAERVLKFAEPDDLNLIAITKNRINTLKGDIEKLNKTKEYFKSLDYNKLYKIGIITKEQMTGLLKINKQNITLILKWEKK